jgi:lipopolysaccharide biosynthesis glycosyltransferase
VAAPGSAPLTRKASYDLELVTAVDNGYVLPLLVSLTSLRSTLRPTVTARLHLIHLGLASHHLELLAQIMPVDAIVPDPALIARVPTHRRFPPEAACPLLLDKLLPGDLKRVVFLDADTLVLDDVTELATIDLESHPFGAVVDGAIPTCGSPRGVPDWNARRVPADAPYFNAGVLVIDLAAWRAAEVGERALEYVGATAASKGLLHQEGLNAVCWNAWTPLPPRWNVPGFAGRPFGPPIPERPAIIHFAGRFKPWRSTVGGAFAERYREVLRDVASTVARRPTVAERLLGNYDRMLRDRLHPFERALWNRGVF